MGGWQRHRPVKPTPVRTSQTSPAPPASNQPVKVVVLQLVGHGPLVVVLQVHHHGQHLGHCGLGTKGQSSVSKGFPSDPTTHTTTTTRGVKAAWTLTGLSHDGRVLPQHGCRRLGQRDDHLQGQLPLHVGQVGVGAQLKWDGSAKTRTSRTAKKKKKTTSKKFKWNKDLQQSCSFPD